ncbi:MAG: helix-turn-helix domain-containing protein [Bacteroidales bacterium]|nr:helix-turn-helix domain-containing protein [Bacteroidales bacterium]
MLRQTGSSSEIYVSEDIAILHSLRPLMEASAAEMLQTPQYIELGRIVLVTGGRATHHINLVPYETEAGDILVIPQHNYISVASLSDDYEGQMLSFGHLPVDFEKCARLHLQADDFQRIRHYVDLLWEIVHRPYDRQTVEHLETALLYDLKLLHAHQSSENTAKLSRGQRILQQFLDTIGRKDPLPRNVKAYADYLCITPNHLSAVIREQSGRSVMDWLNAHCILRAQVLLRHTDLSIYEIADTLGFQSATFFSRFFHRETGVTPKEYRTKLP